MPPILLVCAPHSAFDDDVQTVCGLCYGRCFHRPHAPTGIERVCLECYLKIRRPDDAWSITFDTLEELRTWLSTRGEKRH